MSSDKRKAIQRAMTLVQEGQLQEAIAEYDAILNLDPSDTSLCNALGDLYVHVGAMAEATACYLKLVDVLKAEGWISRAIAVYRKIVKLDPNNLSALRACADLYVQEGLRAEAKHLYLIAAERALQLGLDKQALEAYERLAPLEPGDDAGAAKLATLLTREGKRSDAAERLGRLAQECRAQGQLESARALYRQMVEIAPEIFSAWYCLGRVEFEVGRLQDAEEHLHRAAQLDANSPLPHLLLGHVYEQQMQFDRAKAAWRTLLAFDPTHQEAHHRLGLLYLNEGDTEAAVREFDAAARSLGASGDLERAILLLGELGQAADHPAIQERLGELLERSGRPDEAKAAHRRAADLRLAMGREQEGQRIAGPILSLDPDDAGAEGLPIGMMVEGGTVTLAPPGYSPPVSSNVGDGSDESRELPTDNGDDRRDEMGWVSGETVQEDLMILKAEEGSVGGVPDAFAIVDFYLAQGMDAEARTLLRRLIAAEPGDVGASGQLALLESKALTEAAPVAPEVEVIQVEPLDEPEDSGSFTAIPAALEHTGEPREESAGVAQTRSSREKEYVDLMAELENEVLVQPVKGVPAEPSDHKPALGGVIGPPDQTPEACEAHYRLGMAYRELGLPDEAIAEFRRSAADERLILRACDMIGVCLLAKGDAEAAIHELERGVSIAGRPPEEYRGIMYSLATAYQSIGDPAMAASILRDLEAESPSFRDVKDRLRKLQEGLRGDAGRAAESERSLDATGQARSG